MPAVLNAWLHAPTILFGEKAAAMSSLGARMTVALQALRRTEKLPQ